MVHGPCELFQRGSLCMKEGKCSMFYPKKFQPTTLHDADEFLIYRRRDDGRTILKNEVLINNQNIVQFNAKLLRRCQTHINVEWCDQNTSIKYLFKYINKGYNRISTIIEPIGDEITLNITTNTDEIK